MKLPAPPGLEKAAPEAVQVFFPAGLLVVVQERSPPEGGVNGGETAKPPPDTCDFPVQFADVVAAPPEAIGTVTLCVVAAALVFEFFATAGPARASVSTLQIAAAPISRSRGHDRALSFPGKVERSYPRRDATSAAAAGLISRDQAIPGRSAIGAVDGTWAIGVWRYLEMKRKRSRVALVGVLALALSVTVGLATGSVAEAKKKKKSPTVANVSNTTPRAIPDRPADVNSTYGRLDTVLTVGKKFKGKSVGVLELTFQTTGDAPSAADDLRIDITAPNGYRLPGDWWDNSIGGQNIGLLTITPNSPARTCDSPSPPCAQDPFQTLNRPFAGTVGDNTFQWFRGLPMRGNWTVTALDRTHNDNSVLNSVALRIFPA